MVTLTAPYIAGFLAFRETPFLLEALQRLKKNQPTLLPQVVFVDGNGLFHYRGEATDRTKILDFLFLLER
uniref:Uncharacterized protein n=1 Tax=Pundamilia nyererei TaxID=303518 RepID=A0A3B4F452_9CICH